MAAEHLPNGTEKIQKAKKQTESILRFIKNK